MDCGSSRPRGRFEIATTSFRPTNYIPILSIRFPFQVIPAVGLTQAPGSGRMSAIDLRRVHCSPRLLTVC